MPEVISDSRLARAFVMGACPPLASEPCPSADELWAALDPDVAPSKDRYRVLNHCARCPSCAQDLQVTKSFIEDQLQSKAPPVDLSGHAQPKWPGSMGQTQPRNSDQSLHREDEAPRAPVTTLHRRRNWLAGAGVMGGLAAAAALAFFLLPKQDQTQTTYRSDPSLVELSAEALQNGPPDVSQYRFQANHFSWPAGTKAAQSYTLKIVDAKFQARCSIEHLDRPEATVTTKNCPGFNPAQPFYWQVHTLLEGGKESRSSFVSQLPKRGS